MLTHGWYLAYQFWNLLGIQALWPRTINGLPMLYMTWPMNSEYLKFIHCIYFSPSSYTIQHVFTVNDIMWHLLFIMSTSSSCLFVSLDYSACPRARGIILCFDAGRKMHLMLPMILSQSWLKRMMWPTSQPVKQFWPKRLDLQWATSRMKICGEGEHNHNWHNHYEWWTTQLLYCGKSVKEKTVSA